MNLIEQLSGYDKASEDFKKLHLNLKEQQKSNKIFMDAFDALKTELLEYRRQHNIFEAGDFIVYGSITALFVVEQEGTPMLLRHSRTGRIFRKPVGGNMRHANDAEIKAGKRLEVS